MAPGTQHRLREGLPTDQGPNECSNGGALRHLPRSSPSEARRCGESGGGSPAAWDPAKPAEVVRLDCAVYIFKMCQHLEIRLHEQIWFLGFSQESETSGQTKPRGKCPLPTPQPPSFIHFKCWPRKASGFETPDNTVPWFPSQRPGLGGHQARHPQSSLGEQAVHFGPAGEAGAWSC